MNLGLEGKLALVVGASRGMGLAVVQQLKEAGCLVVGIARTGVIYACDITDQDALAKTLRAVQDAHGAPDIVVHVAGGSMGVRDHTQPWEAWEKVMRLNLGAAHEINRVVIPEMVRRGWGRVVHFSSNGVKIGSGKAPYTAAKHAVEGYVQIMGREYSKHGVVITAVAPGPIYTPGLFMYSQGEEWTKDFMDKYVPMGRWGRDEEVSAVVAFLCSERASYMAGAVVPVDGGMR